MGQLIKKSEFNTYTIYRTVKKTNLIRLKDYSIYHSEPNIYIYGLFSWSFLSGIHLNSFIKKIFFQKFTEEIAYLL